MAITALPQATIHLLGSAQVLTTPTALIKELIDNSLDAKSSAVDVLITPDTLAKLQVRDNGHGIAQDDLGALGRRGHTSKLRSFEELRSLGGTSLGFRGEALASAVQLGEVTITTKTEGEPVATCVKLNSTGGVKQQSHASHPVGTTVTVVNFAANLPVRKKTFEREAPKTIQAIKRLLQSYALARPSVKFGLKVTKNGKGSWSYAPRSNDGIEDAVSQVIGRDTSSQCMEKSLKFSEPQYSNAIEADDEFSGMMVQKSKHDAFAFEAFLPRPGADASMLGKSQYLSIDSRPVSHEKGTMKKVVALFKKYLRNSLTESSEKLNNPFLRLNLTCPSASYDANVEPAKDNVLFGNENLILDSFEHLMRATYGDFDIAPKLTSPAPRTKKNGDFDFEVLLSRKTHTPLPTSSNSHQSSDPVKSPLISQATPLQQVSSDSLRLPSPRPSITETEMTSAFNDDVGAELMTDEQQDTNRRNWGFDMSQNYSEEIEGYEPRSNKKNQHQSHEYQHISKNSLNPWLIAKLNTPVSRNIGSLFNTPKNVSNSNEDTHDSSVKLNTEFSMRSSASQPQQTVNSDKIMAAQPSMTNVPQKILVHTDLKHSLLQQDQNITCHGFFDDIFTADESPVQTVCGNDFVSAREIPELPDIATQPAPARKQRQGPPGPHNPFVPPAKTRNSEHDTTQTTLPVQYKHSRNIDENSAEVSHSSLDLAWAMDYEHRKERATRRRQDEIRNARNTEQQIVSTAPRSSPHKNRYNAAIASLEMAQPHRQSSKVQLDEPFKTTLADNDSRAYLMRHNKSTIAQLARPGETPTFRAMSMKLPLERIRAKESLHDLLKSMPTDMEVLKRLTTMLSEEDLYTNGDMDLPATVTDAENISDIAKKLQRVVKTWVSREAVQNRKHEVEFNYGDLPTCGCEDDVV